MAVHDGTGGAPDLDLLRRRAAAAGVRERDEGLVVCENLVRIYQTEGVEVQALQGLDLAVAQGEMIAVIGASGSGKSTLLGILSGQDVPTAGSAEVAGHDLLAMKRRERLGYRRTTVGFVLQQTARNLLPYLTAAENVMLPMTYTGIKRSRRRARAEELLGLLGVGQCRDRTPDALSGGEQQRVAIAVANANEPQVLFADEPTGELDTATSDEVFAALRRANEDLGVTVVVVTHDALVSEQVQRTVRIRNGRTSTEVLRRVVTDEAGVEALTAEEYAVLDRNGRLQLPGEFTERLHMRKRVRLALESDHIGVWPDAAGARTADRTPGRSAEAEYGAQAAPAGEDGLGGRGGDDQHGHADDEGDGQ
ncbi:ABC-type lipoprotein export system, ATPase component [Streptomyces sp. DvalAA-14]|uniref:ABC transporter ATP-binding protein n=1 Tax=Streptomyces sp. DvalAA-14 TaxID=1839759 RepID=UPI00081B73DD|nr:ABC-type lipoprotein export system, ATPase component [Streptomyces sp. DvalAA-14]